MDKKYYVWGTGRLAGISMHEYFYNVEIEGYIDSNENINMYNGIKVIRPKDILQLHYDAIFVANLYTREIYDTCVTLGIDLSKVIFLYNNMFLNDYNKNYDYISKIMGEDFSSSLKNRNYMIRRGATYKGVLVEDHLPEKLLFYQQRDYVRIKTLELLTREIKKRNLVGNIAELGVFRGEFSQFFNYYFPNKILYLFDTFDGFEEKEFIYEKDNNNCGDAFGESLKKTEVNIVLDKMDNRDVVKIYKGYFPDSLNGLEDNFCLVSIDVDFEQSIENGLEYFYPRLEQGGYILIHDYNDGMLKGVQKAVDEFEKKHNLCMCKLPICDVGGSLIITK